MDTGPGGKEHSGKKYKTTVSGQSLKSSAVRAENQETLQLDGEPMK